jgi:phage tail-like protein
MADGYKPTTKTYFKVEIDQISYTNFISVSGLDATADVSDDMGGQDINPRKVIGKVKYNTVKLVRNADVEDKLLRNWWKTVEDGNPEPRSLSVVFMSRDGKTELSRRDLHMAVPCAWGISDLSSTESGLNTETISVVYESAEWN